MDDGSEKRVFEIDANSIETMDGASNFSTSGAMTEDEIVKFSDELISEDEIPF